MLDSDHAQRIRYSSSDEGVAVVSDEGLVTAVNPGSADIRLAASEGARTAIHVEVVGTPTTRLRLNTSSLTMEKGQVTGLTATFNDGADDTRIEWRSENPEIATVDAGGRVTARQGGRTTVYALSPGGLRADVSVFVHLSASAVRITPEALTVGTGASLQMGATYFPEDATDEVIRWVSSDENLLKVDADGTLHALGVGKPVLTAFTGEGLSDSAVINVEQSAASFDLVPGAVTIERGVQLDLEPRFLNADGSVNQAASGHYIQWQSEKPEVASVEGGHVVGLSSGTTRITATADGMTAQCLMRVTVFVRKVELNRTEDWLLKEDTAQPIQLTATITPSDPDDPAMTWTTSNGMVAGVDENGLVTLTGGYGTAVITARAASGAEAKYTVNVVLELPDESEENAQPQTTKEEIR